MSADASKRVLVAIRTRRGMNDRECWQARKRRVTAERQAVAWVLRTVDRPATPCTVWLTRIGPSNGLDDDNLAGALKAVRDQVAEWLGVDDKRSDVVRYRYAQRRAREWGVEIGFGPPDSTLFAQEPGSRAAEIAQEAA